jgi:hypothetical protein
VSLAQLLRQLQQQQAEDDDRQQDALQQLTVSVQGLLRERQEQPRAGAQTESAVLPPAHAADPAASTATGAINHSDRTSNGTSSRSGSKPGAGAAAARQPADQEGLLRDALVVLHERVTCIEEAVSACLSQQRALLVAANAATAAAGAAATAASEEPRLQGMEQRLAQLQRQCSDQAAAMEQLRGANAGLEQRVGLLQQQLAASPGQLRSEAAGGGAGGLPCRRGRHAAPASHPQPEQPPPPQQQQQPSAPALSTEHSLRDHVRHVRSSLDTLSADLQSVRAALLPGAAQAPAQQQPPAGVAARDEHDLQPGQRTAGAVATSRPASCASSSSSGSSWGEDYRLRMMAAAAHQREGRGGCAAAAPAAQAVSPRSSPHCRQPAQPDGAPSPPRRQPAQPAGAAAPSRKAADCRSVPLYRRLAGGHLPEPASDQAGVCDQQAWDEAEEVLGLLRGL